MYGAHTRSESVAERLDQIGYDLAHADGLRARGVRVNENALARERDELQQRKRDDRVTHHYDAARLADVRARQDIRDGARARDRRGRRSVPDIESAHRRHRRPVAPSGAPFLDAGVPFVVASDDPGIFDTTIRAELDWVAREAALEPGAVEDLIERAWRSRSEVLTGRET